MPICPYGRCSEKKCPAFEYCRTKKPTPYDRAMKAIKEELGFLIARPWSMWEIMEKVFPKSVLQQSQQRVECLADLLEALEDSGFIAVEGSENVLEWEWKPGRDLRVKSDRTDKVFLPRRRSSTLPEWMQQHT